MGYVFLVAPAYISMKCSVAVRVVLSLAYPAGTNRPSVVSPAWNVVMAHQRTDAAVRLEKGGLAASASGSLVLSISI